MKKSIIAIALLAGLVAAASAQPMYGRGTGPGTGPMAAAVQAEKTTIEGTLALVDGHIGLKSGDTTYYVGGLNRLVGFVDGLKEGAKVKAEGYAVSISADKKLSAFRATSVTVGDRSIDLSNSMIGRAGRAPMGGRMNSGRMGGYNAQGWNNGPAGRSGGYGWKR